MMKTEYFIKFLYRICLCIGILCLVGCGKPDSDNNEPISAITPDVTDTAEISGTLAPTAMPVATPTVSLTPTPTPTPIPTPTELPLYDKVIAWESEHSADEHLPVQAALLVNMTENKVLYARHATETIYPASITKLMTALVALSMEEDLTKTVEVSKTAVVPVIPSAKMCGFHAGDRILLRDLLGCMLIYSGNDTSVAVAEHLAVTEQEFVALMNKKAKELGLVSSVFCNSHGLPDDNHVTSAYDIYLIMQNLFPFEEFLDIIELDSIQVDVLRGEALKTLSFTSTNQFLTGAYQIPEGLTLLGGKTGTTNKAGCCLALYVQDKSSNCYIAEIFGAASYEELYSNMIQLLSFISEE